MERSSAPPGERAWAGLAGRAPHRAWRRRGLPLEPYRYQSSYALAHGAHNAAALLAARQSGEPAVRRWRGRDTGLL